LDEIPMAVVVSLLRDGPLGGMDTMIGRFITPFNPRG
jgi:hypothetical protein